MIIVEYHEHCHSMFCRLPGLYFSQIVLCQIFGHPFAWRYRQRFVPHLLESYLHKCIAEKLHHCIIQRLTLFLALLLCVLLWSFRPHGRYCSSGGSISYANLVQFKAPEWIGVFLQCLIKDKTIIVISPDFIEQIWKECWKHVGYYGFPFLYTVFVLYLFGARPSS